MRKICGVALSSGRTQEDEGVVEKLVPQSFRDREVDVRREEVNAISRLLVEEFAVETWESLAPERFLSECLPLGLAKHLGAEKRKRAGLVKSEQE